MKPARTLSAVLLTLGTLMPGWPIAAQVSVAANAAVFSSYVWRGVTYTNNVVLQPDASVTVPVKNASLTAGLWANIEPARYDRYRDISESGGTKGFDIAEINWTGELEMPLSERATLAFGSTGYVFPNDDGLTATSNTVELYGRASLTGTLTPTLSVYYDVGKVDGAYLEGSLERTFAASERLSVTLGALGGFSAGQDADFDAMGEPQAESFNFAKNGFTHADLWAVADFTAGAVAISPMLHLIVTGDESTKSTKMVRDPGTGLPELNRTGAKLWLGVTIGWSR